MKNIVKICAFLFAFYTHVNCQKKHVAMGNVQTVINGPKLYTSNFDKDDVIAPAPLWCEVRTGDEREPIKEAKFIRYSDKRQITADVDPIHKRAYLNFPKDSSTPSAGKYRCEITLDDNSVVFGNMFAYHHVIVDNADFNVKETFDPVLVEGPTQYFTLDSNATLRCPVAGFPAPSITWYKNNFPLELNDRISFNKNTQTLTIFNVNVTDVGEYRCEASNSFANTLNGAEQQFQAKFAQKLEIGSDLGWLLPLIVIIIILLLLFIVIFVCQRCQKYKSADYNVEARERGLHSDTTPLKTNSV